MYPDNHADRTYLLSRGIGRPEQMVTVWPGFELAPFLISERWRGTLRRELGFSQEILVGIVGRLVPIKNHEAFLALAQALRARGYSQVRFLIAGDGPLRQVLEAEASRQDLNGTTVFLGWRREMAQVYADLDLVCLTSRREGSPACLVEAMAAAKPIVSVDVGDAAALLGEPFPLSVTEGRPQLFQVRERGIVVEPDRLDAFIEAVIYLLERPARRQAMGLAAQAFVQRALTKERFGEETLRLYERLLNAHNGGGYGCAS